MISQIVAFNIYGMNKFYSKTISSGWRDESQETARPENLSSSPEAIMVKGDNQLLRVSSDLHTYASTLARKYTHTHIQNKTCTKIKAVIITFRKLKLAYPNLYAFLKMPRHKLFYNWTLKKYLTLFYSIHVKNRK